MASPTRSALNSSSKKSNAAPAEIETPPVTNEFAPIDWGASPKKRRLGFGAPFADPKLRVKLLSENAVAPKRGSAQAAGYDISSAYDYKIPPGGRAVVKTDLAIALPSGTYGRIAPRSGLAVKSGIGVGGGVVDEDYRGNIGVCLFNHSEVEFEVKKGDRVAQLVLEVIRTPQVEVVEELEETERGDAGFGSTGVSAEATAKTNT